jgi:hypothetical protein
VQAILLLIENAPQAIRLEGQLLLAIPFRGLQSILDRVEVPPLGTTARQIIALFLLTPS